MEFLSPQPPRFLLTEVLLPRRPAAAAPRRAVETRRRMHASEKISYRCVSLLLVDGPKFLFVFCLIILAFDLCRSWRRAFCPVFPVRSPRDGGSLQAPLCPPPTPVSRRVDVPKEINKGTNKRKNKWKRVPRPLHLACRCHERGCGEEQWKSLSGAHLVLGTQRLRLFLRLLLPLPTLPELPDTSLPASPFSSSGGTSLPTSVEERKSSTARPHLLSASRSRIVHLLFHLLVSFSSSAHRIFCCIFHSGHTLKRWSLVCVGHLHHQHWASGRTLAHCRY